MAKNDKRTRSDSGELDRSTSRFAWILAALVVVLLGLVSFYMREGQQGTRDVETEAVVAPASVAALAEQPEQTAAEQNSQSEAAATQIVTSLEHFQDLAESGMDYDEYDKKLNNLRTDINDRLASFVRHNPDDETFRREVAAAVRDYTAAGNWWKTTITNSRVFTEADRNERTQRDWASARTHLTNAEQMLNR